MRAPREAGRAPAAGIRPLPLATGELGARDARELAVLLEQLRDAGGFSGAHYKERYIRRRLGVRMRKLGLERYGEYAAHLRSEPEEYDRLIRTITINFSRFFRNPDVWEVLEREIVPEILARSEPRLRLWVAGAACGEEAYSLAILVREAASAAGVPAGRARILATDVDPGALERARAGVYPDTALRETSESRRRRWFEAGDGRRPWRVRREVRELVDFQRRDLIADPYPQRRHLVLCRNVLIYFGRRLQERILTGLEAALVHGGYLVLGKVESPFGDIRTRLESVRDRERIYRRQ